MQVRVSPHTLCWAQLPSGLKTSLIILPVLLASTWGCGGGPASIETLDPLATDQITEEDFDPVDSPEPADAGDEGDGVAGVITTPQDNVPVIPQTFRTEVRFHITPMEGAGDLTVQAYAFTVNGRPLPEGTYTWAFGDQMVETEASEAQMGIHHTFRAAGTYAVRLTVVLAGAASTISCVHDQSGTVQGTVTVWPTISGRVVDPAGNPLPNVELVASPPGSSVTTDSNGRYMFVVPLHWTGTIVPSESDLIFSPTQHAFNELSSDAFDMDFVAASAINLPPVAEDLAIAMAENTPENIGLVASDPEDDPITYVVVSLPEHGKLVDMGNVHFIVEAELPYAMNSATGVLGFLPDANYSGLDHFLYSVTDGAHMSDEAEVTIRIVASNAPPEIDQGDALEFEVAADSQAGDPGNAITFTASDGDAGFNDLTWSVSQAASHGSVGVVDAVGGPGDATVFRYQPEAGFTGFDQFTVQVTDDQGESDSCIVNVAVTAANAPPSIDQGSLRELVVEEGSLGTHPANGVAFTASDTDAGASDLTWSVAADASHGTVTISGAVGGPGVAAIFRYQPDAGFVGTDEFTIQVADEQGATDSCLVSITVSATNSPPVIVQGDVLQLEVDKDSLASNPGNALSFSASDSDAGADDLVWSVSVEADHGTVSIDDPVSGPDEVAVVRYEPAAGFSGTDSFSIAVTDNENASDWCTVYVTVNAANVVPVIAQGATQQLVVDADSSADDPQNALTFTATDADAGADGLTWTVSVPASHGTVSIGDAIGGPGDPAVFRYQPAGGYSGADQFAIKVTDDEGAIDSCIVFVTVNAVNSAPVIDQGSSQSINVSANSSGSDPENAVTFTASDSDAGANDLTWSVSGNASHGTVTIDGAAGGPGDATVFHYEPDAGFTGSDQFSVRVTDNALATDSATVYVTVSGASAEYTVSGTVVDVDGSPRTSVTVNFTGSGNHANEDFVATTAGDGSYDVAVPAGWTGSITSDANYRFEPSTLNLAGVSNDRPNQNFTAFRNFFVATSGGQDSGNGLINAPFDSLHHAVQQADAGDTVYLRGGTHVHTNNVSLYGFGGTAAQPITIAGYPGESAKIQGSGGSATRLFQVRGGAAHWVFRDFEISDGQYQCFELSGAANIEFDNVVAHDSREPFVAYDSDQITFRNCEAYNFTANGFHVWGSSTDVVFEDCVAHDSVPDENCDGWEIANLAQRSVLRRCEAYNCADAGYDLAGSTVIEDCVAHDCEAGFKLWDSRKTDSNGKHKLIRALVYRCNAYGVLLAVRYSGSHGGGGGHNHADILNCTILDCKLNIWVGTSSDQGYCSTATIKNTISSHAANQGAGGTIRALMVTPDNNCRLLEETNNLWHRADGNDVINYHNVNYTVSDINDGYWKSITGFGQDSFSADPQYVSFAGENFQLSSGSPCINAGVDIGLGHLGSAPDLGAFERQ